MTATGNQPRAEGSGRGRRRVVAGNWKMHHDHLQAIRTVQEIGMRLPPDAVSTVDVIVHPPFTDLRSVQTVLEDRAIPLALGAQHCSSEDSGAFTGEVAPPMLSRLGVRYVLVGHSERRTLFGQDDSQVAAITRAILRHHMVPVLCVGETEAERNDGHTERRLEAQVTAATAGLSLAGEAALILAYEPLWAIGTGATATAADAQAACGHVRRVLARTIGEEAAEATRVLYGGSVNGDNAAELVRGGQVDGVLVGGASLQAESFCAIVAAVASLR